MSAYKRTCDACGKVFKTTYCYAKYCSISCRDEGAKKVENGSDRPFTVDTPFLCRKWRAEGMSINAIGKILGRSPANVCKALAMWEQGQKGRRRTQ